MQSHDPRGASGGEGRPASELLTPLPAGPPGDPTAGYTLEVPPGWRQGRGAFGGISIGAAIRAIEARVADPRRAVRAVTAEIPAPVEEGQAHLAVEVLRAGSSVTTARAALVQAGATRLHAVAVLAAARAGTEGLRWRELAPPTAPAWRDVAPLALPRGPGPWPEFIQHFELRVVEGLPFTGREGARTLGWVRPRARGGPQDAALIAALIDAWWPVVYARSRAPRPIATIAFTLDVVDGLAGLDPEAPLLYRGTAPVCGDGYCLETRELWGEDGRLVAINQQTIAIIA
jgi:acyl-CoA thioesterase